MATGSMEYHRLHTHGQSKQTPADALSWSTHAGWAGAALLVTAVAIGAFWFLVTTNEPGPGRSTGASQESSSGSRTDASTSRENEDDEAGADALDRDAARVAALQTHFGAWNSAAGPLVEAIADDEVSIEEMVEVAERELPVMKKAAEAVTQASLGMEDREVARLVGAIGRNYQRKYVAVSGLVKAIERQDEAATDVAAARVDELATEGQDLARELVAFAREQDPSLELDIDS